MNDNKIITSVNPKVSNWKDLTEQFGIAKPIGRGYKTAVEIYKDLVFGNQRFDLEDKTEQPKNQKKGVLTYLGNDIDNTFSCIHIDCEKDNFDSATCTFQYIGMEGEKRVYEYLGTAK